LATPAGKLKTCNFVKRVERRNSRVVTECAAEGTGGEGEMNGGGIHIGSKIILLDDVQILLFESS
jgi:hypothetical protein